MLYKLSVSAKGMDLVLTVHPCRCSSPAADGCLKSWRLAAAPSCRRACPSEKTGRCCSFLLCRAGVAGSTDAWERGHPFGIQDARRLGVTAGPARCRRCWLCRRTRVHLSEPNRGPAYADAPGQAGLLRPSLLLLIASSRCQGPERSWTSTGPGA